MKAYTLPAEHYAANWKLDDGVRLDTAGITELGSAYARSAGQQKEDLLLQLCQSFHPYLMKYLVMICRGHVPMWKGMNSDSAKFLMLFLPKGGKLDMETARWIVRSLHLAFKGIDGGEVYDVLMQQFLMAATRYDPDYTGKIRRVAECIDHELSKSKQIRVTELNRHVDFDCDRHLRFLARRSFLQAVKGKSGKISGWIRSEQWPPPASFFDVKPVGFASYLQTWFRYYLQAWIEKRRSELETKDGVYSYGLRGGKVPNGYTLRAGNIDGVFLRAESEEVAQPHGKHIPGGVGQVLSDNHLASSPLDVGTLNITWVNETQDPLFRDLTRNERYAIYLSFARNLKPKELGEALGMTTPDASNLVEGLLARVRQIAEKDPDLY